MDCCVAFVQQKLEEVPESIRMSLLKGIALSLVDMDKDQRVADGASSLDIAARAELDDTRNSTLARAAAAGPRVRLLEIVPPGRYRLSS